MFIRDPKVLGGVHYDDATDRKVLEGLATNGIRAVEMRIDAGEYREFFERAGYLKNYPRYYPKNIREKSLEHFIAAKLLALKKGDVYVDIASEASPVPEIYGRLYGLKAYRQDLSYPVGLNGDRIGGDASRMPVPGGFADKMALHCSFEHFEGGKDTDFIREASRVLKGGGRCAIVPLYLFERYAIQTDPGACWGVKFEEGVPVYCARGWANRHGRFYDAAHLKSRVLDNLGEMKYTLYRIVNAREIDTSCYARFALLLEKP